MPLTDKAGRTWAHSETVKAGDKLTTDDGFTCIKEGTVVTVLSDQYREGLSGLYVECEEGEHFLDGQLGKDGELVGLYAAIPPEGEHAVPHEPETDPPIKAAA